MYLCLFNGLSADHYSGLTLNAKSKCRPLAAKSRPLLALLALRA